MASDAFLTLLSAVTLLAEAASLAIPLVCIWRVHGTWHRKCMAYLLSVVSSWLIVIMLFCTVVLSALHAAEPLTRYVLANPDAWSFWSSLRSAAEAVEQYWYLVGQVAIPVLAAIATLPIAFAVCSRLLPSGRSAQSAA
jgi:hypothetical protein